MKTQQQQHHDTIELVGSWLDTAANKAPSTIPMEISSPIKSLVVAPCHNLTKQPLPLEPPPTTPASIQHNSTVADLQRPSMVATILSPALGSAMTNDGHVSGPEHSMLSRASASITSAANILQGQPLLGRSYNSSGSSRHTLRNQSSHHSSAALQWTEGFMRQSTRNVRERKNQVVEPVVDGGDSPSGTPSVDGLGGLTLHQQSSKVSEGSTRRTLSHVWPTPDEHTPPDDHGASMVHRASMSLKNIAGGLAPRQPSGASGTSEVSSNFGMSSRRLTHVTSDGTEMQPDDALSSRNAPQARGSVIVRARSSIMTQINTIAATPRVVPFAPEVMNAPGPAKPSSRRKSSGANKRPRKHSRFQAIGTKLLLHMTTAHVIDHRRISASSSIERHRQVLEQYHIRSRNEVATEAQVSIPKYLVSPNSKLYKVWQLWLVAIIYYQVVAVPYSLVFGPADNNPTHDEFGLVTSAMFALDIVLNFMTALTDDDNGGIITNHKVIALTYLRGWFLIDALSAIPIDAIVYYLSTDHSGTFKFIGVLKTSRLPRLARVLSLARILQFLRLPHEWKHWLLYSRYAHLIRLCTTITAFAYIIHVMACVWYGAVASPQWLAWIETNYKDKAATNPYVLSYFSMLTTTMGQSNNLYTNTEYAFSCCCMIQGCLLMAVVFGDVGDLISNYYEDQNNYHHKMESLLASMALMHIPSDLQTRISDYYETMYDRYGTLNGDTVLFTKELSKNLSNEVELYLRMGMITRCPMFRLCSPEFVQELVMQLQFNVFLADDFVVGRGEIGYEMYFIQSGSCDVMQSSVKYDDHARKKNKPIHEATGTLVRTLLEGDFFGEIALLMNCKQSVTLKATTFTEVCVLTRDVFHAITAKYVDDHAVIESFIREKYDPQVLNAAMEMQIDPIQAKRKAIVGCLNDLTERLEYLEARLIRLETPDHNAFSGHDSHHDGRGDGSEKSASHDLR